MKSLFGHLQINVNTVNITFYKDLLAFMEWRVIYEDATMLGMGSEHHQSLWFAGGAKAVSNDYDGPGVNHIGLAVGAPADVEAVAGYLEQQGVPLLFETPRHRPEFAREGATYFQIMFESPDRVLFEVVYIGPI